MEPQMGEMQKMWDQGEMNMEHVVNVWRCDTVFDVTKSNHKLIQSNHLNWKKHSTMVFFLTDDKPSDHNDNLHS